MSLSLQTIRLLLAGAALLATAALLAVVGILVVRGVPVDGPSLVGLFSYLGILIAVISNLLGVRVVATALNGHLKAHMRRAEQTDEQMQTAVDEWMRTHGTPPAPPA